MESNFIDVTGTPPSVADIALIRADTVKQLDRAKVKLKSCGVFICGSLLFLSMALYIVELGLLLVSVCLGAAFYFGRLYITVLRNSITVLESRLADYGDSSRDSCLEIADCLSDDVVKAYRNTAAAERVLLIGEVAAIQEFYNEAKAALALEEACRDVYLEGVTLPTFS